MCLQSAGRCSILPSLSRTTEFRLFGGLGNQLFILAAGRYLEEHANHVVSFNTWYLKRFGDNHDASITDRGFPDTFIEKAPFMGDGNRFLSKRLSGLEKAYIPDSGLGWDPQLATLRRGRSVKGYFQSWRYADTLRNKITRLDLIRREGASPWLAKELARAALCQPVMVHVRRGDYRKLSSTFGLVGSDYFGSAIDYVRASGIENEVWVFSDDIAAAAQIFSGLRIPARIIEPPPGGDPGESILLMAHGRANIISNSTFAWWGAFLNLESELVVAPSPWFREISIPAELLPDTWVKLPHRFSSA